jgi:hypothetical protein
VKQTNKNRTDMIKFKTEFECATRQDAINILREIINQLEGGYSCGYLYGADSKSKIIKKR